MREDNEVVFSSRNVRVISNENKAIPNEVEYAHFETRIASEFT